MSPTGIPMSDLDLGEPMDLEQTLKMACPVCRTTFKVKAGEHVINKGVHWSSEGKGGRLTFELEVVIEHTCPKGTVIKRKT